MLIIELSPQVVLQTQWPLTSGKMAVRQWRRRRPGSLWRQMKGKDWRPEWCCSCCGSSSMKRKRRPCFRRWWIHMVVAGTPSPSLVSSRLCWTPGCTLWGYVFPVCYEAGVWPILMPPGEPAIRAEDTQRPFLMVALRAQEAEEQRRMKRGLECDGKINLFLCEFQRDRLERLDYCSIRLPCQLLWGWLSHPADWPQPIISFISHCHHQPLSTGSQRSIGKRAFLLRANTFPRRLHALLWQRAENC